MWVLLVCKTTEGRIRHINEYTNDMKWSMIQKYYTYQVSEVDVIGKKIEEIKYINGQVLPTTPADLAIYRAADEQKEVEFLANKREAELVNIKDFLLELLDDQDIIDKLKIKVK